MLAWTFFVSTHRGEFEEQKWGALKVLPLLSDVALWITQPCHSKQRVTSPSEIREIHLIGQPSLDPKTVREAVPHLHINTK